jgi:hypothetical protein
MVREDMKHIILFSGGAASSYMADLVAKEHDGKDVVLLHTPTHAEHPDADRFREQVSRHIGIPMTIQADGRSLWELIDDQGILPNHFAPYCTRILKMETRVKFCDQLDDDYILYFGYGVNEWRRIQKVAASGIKCAFPLYDQKIQDATIKNAIREDWKICLPQPYRSI